MPLNDAFYLRCRVLRCDRSLARRLSALTILAVHSVLLAWGASCHSPTNDEIAYLPAGISHWTFGTFELCNGNPPLVRMVAALPVMAAGANTDWSQYHAGQESQASHAVGRDFLRANDRRIFLLFMIARWFCIPFSLVGGWVCYRWATDLYGAPSGMLALVLWCFCPNILGHGQLITADVPVTALGAAASYLFWRWLQRPTLAAAVITGVVLGLAQLTKVVAIVFYLFGPVLWIIWHGSELICPPSRQPGTEFSGEGTDKVSFVAHILNDAPLHLVHIVLMCVISVLVINAGYGFSESFEPLRTFRCQSIMFTGDHREVGNRFAQSRIGFLPLPLPRQYVAAIDGQKAVLEHPGRAYMRGEWKNGGWWYYYVYAMLVKVPIGTLILLCITLWLGRVSHYSSSMRHEIALALPPIVLLSLISSQTALNAHMRYVLPVFPFVFISISKVAKAVIAGHVCTGVLVVAAAGCSVLSSALTYPHSLSYFNELAGGSKNGHWHLDNSNIDWGQDLLLLKYWYEQHPDARPLGLIYFGNVDPRMAGIEFCLPPPAKLHESGVPADEFEQAGPLPGWYAVSVNYLRGRTGTFVSDGSGGRQYVTWPSYTYFLKFKPTDMIGYSIYIYHVTREDADRVRRELGQIGGEVGTAAPVEGVSSTAEQDISPITLLDPEL